MVEKNSRFISGFIEVSEVSVLKAKLVLFYSGWSRVGGNNEALTVQHFCSEQKNTKTSSVERSLNPDQ